VRRENEGHSATRNDYQMGKIKKVQSFKLEVRRRALDGGRNKKVQRVPGTEEFGMRL